MSMSSSTAAADAADRPNLLSPDVIADPYPLYAALRRDRPVGPVEPGGMWAVARYDDVQRVLAQPELFSSAGFRVAVERPWLSRNPIVDSLLMQDPPSHTRLRGLVARAFSPRAMARLDARIRDIATGLADRLVARGEGDFMRDFALPLPARVIAEILGLDPSLHVHFKRWVEDMNAVALPYVDDARIAAIRASIAEMITYFGDVIAARRRRPEDDMISDLLAPEGDGDAMNDDELLSFLFIVLPAGFETTTNLLASSLRVLIQNPGVHDRLRAERWLVPAFVEEVLRYDAPAPAVMRLATRDTEIGRTKVPAGTVLLALLGSANRDERRFTDSDLFDIDRPEKKHLAFGHGIHACLGAVLARMEARIGLDALVSRIERVTAAGPAPWIPSLLLRGPSEFPLRCQPAAYSAAA